MFYLGYLTSQLSHVWLFRRKCCNVVSTVPFSIHSICVGPGFVCCHTSLVFRNINFAMTSCCWHVHRNYANQVEWLARHGTFATDCQGRGYV